jgi:seryl-tRNA synthetase
MTDRELRPDTRLQAKESADAEKARKVDLDAQIAALEATAKELERARDKALGDIPNELDPTVPVSNDERDNAVVKRHGALRPKSADLLHHHELLYMIDGYEPERGVGVAGHRCVLVGGVAGVLPGRSGSHTCRAGSRRCLLRTTSIWRPHTH